MRRPDFPVAPNKNLEACRTSLAVESALDPPVRGRIQVLKARQGLPEKEDKQCLPSSLTRHSPNYRKYEMDLAGRPFSIEVGKVAELANAAAMVNYGETTVMVAVTASPRPRTAWTSSPLSVDFEEKLYAGGPHPRLLHAPGGPPSLPAVLASRLIDRPMRPCSPATCATTCASPAPS